MNNPSIHNLFKSAETSLGTPKSDIGKSAALKSGVAGAVAARGQRQADANERIGSAVRGRSAPSADSQGASDNAVQAQGGGDEHEAFQDLLGAQQDELSADGGSGSPAAGTVRSAGAEVAGAPAAPIAMAATQLAMPSAAVAQGAGSAPGTAVAQGTAAVQGAPAAAAEQPVDLLKLLSDLEAAERAGTAPDDALATAAPLGEARKSLSGQDDDADADADTVIADSPLNPYALLQLLESAAAMAGGAAAATTVTPGSASGGAAGDAGSGDVVLMNAGGGAAPGTSQWQALGADAALLLARRTDTQAMPDAASGTSGGIDASPSKVTLQNFTVDANGATLQVTQFSVPHSDNSAGSAAQPVTERTLSIPVGHRGWSEQVGTQVQWLLDHKIQSARLQVTPDGMGPIEVHLSVDKNDVNVNFVAQHPETRDSLEQSIPQLRAMLAGSGLSLGQATVQQQSQQAPHYAQAPNDANRDADHNDEGAAAAPARVSIGLVDEYA